MSLLLYMIFAPILVGISIYCFKIRNKIIISLFQASMVIAAILNFLSVKANGDYYYDIAEWTNGKGISLYLNNFSAFIIIISTIFFTLFVLYEWKELSKFLMLDFFMLIIQGLTIGLFASNDLFNIFVLMEITTIIITSLIMLRKNFVSYYDGLIYLLVNILGTSFFLFGIGYVYKIYGLFDIKMLMDIINTNIANKQYILPYTFLITGVLFKLGVVPVFSWLVRAHGSYSAPTVISAFLSGLYINTGFIIFMKIQGLFDRLIDSKALILIIGIATAIVGAFYALAQRDIKKMLAYSTVSQIGIILIGMNIDNDYAKYGTMYQILSHSISKVLLFLTAGILVKRYDTRDVHEMQGVAESMPMVAIALVTGIFGITGAPFFSGSIGNYLIGEGITNIILELIIYLISFMNILYVCKLLYVLIGKKEEKHNEPIKLFTLLILSILTLTGGILSPIIMDFIFGHVLVISIELYIKKIVIYLLMLFAGYILYVRKLRGSSFLKKVREIDLPFNYIASCVFILFIIIYTYCSVVG